MSMRKNTAGRQLAVNLDRYGDGYAVRDYNVVGSVYKASLWFHGKKLGNFYEKSEAYAFKKAHQKEQRKLAQAQ